MVHGPPAAPDLVEEVQEATGDSVTAAFVDQGHTGEELAEQAAKRGFDLIVVKLHDANGGSVLLPNAGWSSAPSPGWARLGRLARDYERLPGALAGLHRPFLAVALDHAGAAALGLRPALVRLALLGLVATAVAVAVQGLGSLLVLAVLIAPAVAVRRHASTVPRAMLAAEALAVLAGTAGVYASFQFGSAAGASVALALSAAALGGAWLPATPSH